MPKQLFNEDETWSDEANDFGREVEEAIKPVLREYAEKGYGLRELTYIAIQIISATTMEMIVCRGIKKRKTEHATNKIG